MHAGFSKRTHARAPSSHNLVLRLRLLLLLLLLLLAGPSLHHMEGRRRERHVLVLVMAAAGGRGTSRGGSRGRVVIKRPKANELTLERHAQPDQPVGLVGWKDTGVMGPPLSRGGHRMRSTRKARGYPLQRGPAPVAVHVQGRLVELQGDAPRGPGLHLTQPNVSAQLLPRLEHEQVAHHDPEGGRMGIEH